MVVADNLLFTNFASSLLAATISNVDVVLQVGVGDGALFPSPSGPQSFYVVLNDSAGNVEVARCTSRAGDLLTVVRGQDNTSAQPFTLAITRVELRTTAVVLNEFLQRRGGVMSGDIDLDGNNLVDAIINGPLTQMTAGQIVGVPLRGTAGAAANEISVPATPGRATAGGVDLVVTTDDLTNYLDNPSPGVIVLDTGAAAIVGLRLGGGTGTNPDFRVYGTTAADFASLIHDDTNVLLAASGAASFIFNGADINLGAGVSLLCDDNPLVRPLLSDFAVTRQAVSALANTTLDYTAGQYVELTMDNTITTFDISDPPATTLYGAMRIKVIQVAGTDTIAFPAKFVWLGGVAPDFSATAAAQIDFIDVWTDDAGVTWYGSFGQDGWS